MEYVLYIILFIWAFWTFGAFASNQQWYLPGETLKYITEDTIKPKQIDTNAVSATNLDKSLFLDTCLWIPVCLFATHPPCLGAAV